LKGWIIRPILDQSNQEFKENLKIKCVSHVEKLKLRFLRNKKKLSGSVTHLVLETAIVQNKCRIKQKIQMQRSQNFEVSLHFWRIWPTVRHCSQKNPYFVKQNRGLKSKAILRFQIFPIFW
jgi:hypothetical protein